MAVAVDGKTSLVMDGRRGDFFSMFVPPSFPVNAVAVIAFHGHYFSLWTCISISVKGNSYSIIKPHRPMLL